MQQKGFEILFHLDPARFLSVLTEMLASQGAEIPGQGRDVLNVLKKELLGVCLTAFGAADLLSSGLTFRQAKASVKCVMQGIKQTVKRMFGTVNAISRPLCFWVWAASRLEFSLVKCPSCSCNILRLLSSPRALSMLLRLLQLSC